nr:unnamed protein product [Callosobruchus chinensis]
MVVDKLITEEFETPRAEHVLVEAVLWPIFIIGPFFCHNEDGTQITISGASMTENLLRQMATILILSICGANKSTCAHCHM